MAQTINTGHNHDWIFCSLPCFYSIFHKSRQTHTAEPHTITAFCLLALAVALFYQARRAKIDPEKSLY